MQGRSDKQATRSRHRLMALSILTFTVAMLAVQVSGSVAASVSSFKVAKLVGSKGSGGKSERLTYDQRVGDCVHRR